ncbi:hypothetical protein AB7M22_001045 [Pseudomonas sp. ADAK2 TE3594]
MRFRELSDDMDALVLDGLGDIGLVDGREIAGFFSAPWLQPRMGRINTALREPQFEIRVSDAAGIEPGQVVVIDLPIQDGGGDYDLVKLEPDGTGWVALLLRVKA